MSHPVWTCKCCSVIFAERADFEKHREDCIKRAKACPRCSELFTDVGLNLHLIKSICGLRKYDVKDLHTWATEVNDRRIKVYVKDAHKKILDAVENGKFTIRLTFMDPDAISRMVSELKKLFTNVEITPDRLGTFIDVAWPKPKSFGEFWANAAKACYDDLPEKFLIVPEIGETDAIPEMVETNALKFPRTGLKNVTFGKARMGKSTFLNALLSGSSVDNSTVPVSDKQAQEKEEQGEQ
jgi:hypothetical protein